MFGRPKITALYKNIGSNVKFGKNVVISGLKGEPLRYLRIGSNCVFHDNVEIRISSSCDIGRGNVFHNNVHMVGGDTLDIGNNNWVGERTFLDSTGGLKIDHGCTIGLNCQIWSHVIRPSSTYMPGEDPTPQINMKQSTHIASGVWLQGGNTQVSPGVTIARNTVIIANAVVSKDTERGKVYGGIPIREVKIKGV